MSEGNKTQWLLIAGGGAILVVIAYLFYTLYQDAEPPAVTAVAPPVETATATPPPIRTRSVSEAETPAPTPAATPEKKRFHLSERLDEIAKHHGRKRRHRPLDMRSRMPTPRGTEEEDADAAASYTPDPEMVRERIEEATRSFDKVLKARLETAIKRQEEEIQRNRDRWPPEVLESANQKLEGMKKKLEDMGD